MFTSWYTFGTKVVSWKLHGIKYPENWCCFFTRKTNSIHFDYYVGNVVITSTDCVKELRVWLDNKLYFHHHVNYIFSAASNLIVPINFITYTFSSLDSLLVLYNSLFLSPTTISQQQIPINLKLYKINLYICVSNDFPSNCGFILERLSLRTLYSRRRHLDALFLTNVFNSAVDFLSIIYTVNLRVRSKLFRDFFIFSVSKALGSSPSARCSTVANNICQFMDVFSKR
jgi:hypothetical protein